MKQSQRAGIISLRTIALSSGREGERRYLAKRIDTTTTDPTLRDLIEVEKFFGQIASRLKGGCPYYDDCVALRRWIEEDPE